jgi:hypothetical protein
MRSACALVLTVALAACASQSDKQLEAVKSARSVLAEWALVEQQSAGGNAQATYVKQMRAQARQQLKTAAAELSGQPEAAGLLERLRSGSPGPADLKAAGDALRPLEDSLEAA